MELEVSRYYTSKLYPEQTRYIGSGDNGNPYIWLYSSTVSDGITFSGIAYQFEYGGDVYSDTKVILYDEQWILPDLGDFDWGF